MMNDAASWKVRVVDWARDGVMINIKRFRLKENADEAAFLATDARLQRDFTLKQPGMLECLTAKTTTGEWLVLHTWDVAEMGDSPTAGDDPYLRALTDEWMDFLDESTATSTPFDRQR
jgi:hypothetical protein